MATAKIGQGTIQFPLTEIRPQSFGKIVFGIGGLPQQKIRNAVIPACADHQIRVGRMGCIQARGKIRLRWGGHAVLNQAAASIQDLITPAVVERNIQAIALIRCAAFDLHVEAGFAVVGISADSATSHARFKEKQGLNFPLIADVEHKTIEAFGAWGEKCLAGRRYMGIIRTTFIIDSNGVIERVITKVDTKNAAKQVLKAL